MKCIIPILMLFAWNTFGKETVLYMAPGADLFDLIRGIPPKGGVLMLSKVDGTDGDKDKLPDGLYYIPEDDGLTSEDTPILHVHRKTEQPKNEQKPVLEADKRDTQ
ncbi:uncharacterized protein LOC132902453 [Amyelois transitella]|uniref:uncharacterized protein LOC132902453 n=1 Tax=Amyelois transitella TaxID=680683 RepID=UPI0029902FE8|nr:uncharacterized protein LOC132902453 [Amyelois transitella]